MSSLSRTARWYNHRNNILLSDYKKRDKTTYYLNTLFKIPPEKPSFISEVERIAKLKKKPQWTGKTGDNNNERKTH